MEQQKKLVKLSVEVRSGTARFKVGVQAPSIRRALSMVGGRYRGGEVRVAFPTEPEGFFIQELSGPAGIAEHAHQEAA